MPAKRYSDSAVSAAFPELTGIRHFDAGSYKNVYSVTTNSGRDLHIVALRDELNQFAALAEI